MKKPSKTTHITAKYCKCLPSGIAAITICGTVYTNSKKAAEEMNKTGGIDSVTESHEITHVKQAVSTSNSWILFYLKYLFQWLRNLPLLSVDRMAPYKFMPFELEAYANQYDISYPTQEKCDEWKSYKKIKVKDLKKCAKEWYTNKAKYNYNFSYFVRTIVRPLTELKTR